jgi:hypothetical protein
MKHGDETIKTVIKHFDYVCGILFLAGFVLFFLGLSWGSVTYPWKSGAVISTIIIGFISLVGFVLWELYVDLKES